jgi:hypothetical protein
MTTSSNAITVPTDETTPWQSTGGVQAYWESEGGQKTQSKPQLREVTVKANKIIGHGVKVNVYTAIQIMWMLEAVSAFQTYGGKPREAVANLAYFPDPTAYGDFS